MATFGEIIKQWRLDLRFGLREAARQIGISATYLSRMENNKESVPSEVVLGKMAKIYKKQVDEIFAIADRVPPEIEDVYKKNELNKRKLPELMRTVLRRDLSEEEWDKLIQDVKKRPDQ